MSRRILLADDSVTIQKVIELTFMDEDYEVTAVSNGDEAIGALGREAPDIVLADVHMPGANGYEVCRRAKELHPHVPVLLLVGTFEPFDEAKAREAGADSYLKKPFDSQELLERVGELVGPAASPEPAPAAGEAEGELDEAPEWSSLALESEEPAPTEVLPPDDRFLEEEPEEEPFRWGEAPTMPMPAPPDESRPAIGFRTLDPTLEERAGAPQPGSPSPEAAASAPAAVPGEPLAASVDEGEIPFPIGLSDGDVERIARRVAELVSERVLRDVAWEVVPDLAEVVIKERLRELESEVE